MLDSIYNYRCQSINLSTGGQADESELEAICQAGYELVIDLGLSDANYAVPDEALIIKSRRLDYIHLPVSFEAPEIDQFYVFCEIMQRHRNRKIFLHCAANKRVSVFVALYRIIFEGWSLQDAETDIHAIWEPNSTWQEFIDTVLEKHKCQKLTR
jgi:protein tyrosine phosphatase (PTP) superfamily phosphohydrolase (DUF442 family)